LAEETVEHVLAAGGDAVLYAFRHFPLSTIHPTAELAAEAAEAAAGQGAFWPMHKLLFHHQDRHDPAGLLALARALDLDIARFSGELNGRVHAARVHEDFLSGVRSGVNGTPTFFVNGRRHDGPPDAASLLGAIRRAMSPASTA
jgi:protein-disulfide isomerase